MRNAAADSGNTNGMIGCCPAGPASGPGVDSRGALAQQVERNLVAGQAVVLL